VTHAPKAFTSFVRVTPMVPHAASAGVTRTMSKATATKLLADITEQFGPGMIMRASDLRPREYRSSGSIALDMALGGGWSKNAIIDVVGKESTGKTLIFELAAIEALRSEKMISAIFDLEHAYDVPRLLMLGGDPDKMHLIRADTGKNLFAETCIDMLKVMLASGDYACIGVDSTAAMVSKAEFEIKEAKGEEAQTVAYTARAMSSLLRQVVGTGLLARSGTTLFFMSQMRDNIGAHPIRGMPVPDKRTGGRAIRHYASVQVEIVRGETITGSTPSEKKIEFGHETKVRVRKNKCNATQGRVAMFEIYTEGEVRGLDRVSEVTRMALAFGVIERHGSQYQFPDGHKAKGLEAAIEYTGGDEERFRDLWNRTVSLVDAHQGANALPAEEIGDENF
jgi:recombination protein RecA